MVISFDIDNTLIPYSDEFEVEEKILLSRLLRAEPIRKGTIELFHELENSGHEIWIYTTSFRSPINLKKTFKSYGLNPSKIINQRINQKHSSKIIALLPKTLIYLELIFILMTRKALEWKEKDINSKRL